MHLLSTAVISMGYENQELEALRTENELLRARLGRLEDLASSDPLTGLFNRRGLETHLAAELARGRRTGSPLSVLVIDLDGFKETNDTHGHQRGDELLCWMGSFLRGRLRTSDLCCRTGGDEFVVLLPDTGPAAAASVAAELLHRAERESAPVQFSVGHATSQPHDESPDLLSRGDAAMYAVKRLRRRSHPRQPVATALVPEVRARRIREIGHLRLVPSGGTF